MQKTDTTRIKKEHYTAVPIKILFRIAWLNIYNKKLRSILTVLGVVIGIGAIFFLLSFGLGLQELVSKQIIGDESIKSIEVTTPNSRIIKLNEEAFNKIKSYPHIQRVGQLYSFPSNISFKGGEVGSISYGVDSEYMEITKYNLVDGRLLKKDDSGVVVISKGALKAIGIEDTKEAINQKISIEIPLNNVEAKEKPIKGEFTIIGVVDSGGGTEMYLPSYIFTHAGVEAFTQVKIIADDTKNINSIRQQIQGNGFLTTSPVDTLEQINQIFKFFNIMLVGFGAIGMIVAVLGMFNTLTISLLERTQEIGLMKALGARNTDMRKLFIFEAVLLSFIGAVIGIVTAIFNGLIVDEIMNKFASRRGVGLEFSLFATPAWLILGLVGFMILVGLLVVLMPARRAEKINPIDALRRE